METDGPPNVDNILSGYIYHIQGTAPSIVMKAHFT
jgi:hypothetical protein